MDKDSDSYIKKSMVPAVDWGWQNDKAMTVGGGKQLCHLPASWNLEQKQKI